MDAQHPAASPLSESSQGSSLGDSGEMERGYEPHAEVVLTKSKALELRPMLHRNKRQCVITLTFAGDIHMESGGE